MNWTMVKRAAVAIAAALVLLVVYGVAIEPRLVLDERDIVAELPGLDASWDDERVAVFSDLQTGMWLANTGMVERVVDRVVEVEPAAVLLVGDFVYSENPDVPEQVGNVADLLRPITAAGIPAYAVLGNHDYAVGAAEELTAALEKLGVVVLRNDAAALPPAAGTGGDPLYVVGIGPARPDRVDVDAALSGVPEDAARLTMMHNPTSFPELPPASAPLAVAGHTHCGQIALPGTPRWSYLGLTEEEALAADGYAFDDYGAAGNELFVTCGIGFSLLPMRINAPPQLVLVELSRTD